MRQVPERIGWRIHRARGSEWCMHACMLAAIKDNEICGAMVQLANLLQVRRRPKARPKARCTHALHSIWQAAPPPPSPPSPGQPGPSRRASMHAHSTHALRAGLQLLPLQK